MYINIKTNRLDVIKDRALSGIGYDVFMAVCTVIGAVAFFFGLNNTWGYILGGVLLCYGALILYVRYQKRKQNENVERNVYFKLHLLAEQLRTYLYQNGVMTAMHGDNHALEACEDILNNTCKSIMEILNIFDLSVNRVCVKIELVKQEGQGVVKMLKKFGRANQEISEKRAKKPPENIDNCVFWHLLRAAHLRYEDWKYSKPFQRSDRESLKDKPRFLAIGGTNRDSIPDGFASLFDKIIQNADLVPSFKGKTAQSIWQAFREKVGIDEAKGRPAIRGGVHYKWCVGMLICCPDFSCTGTQAPEGEETYNDIGFLGFDSCDASAVKKLSQRNLNAIAAIVDLLFPIVKRAQKLLNDELAASSSSGNP